MVDASGRIPRPAAAERGVNADIRVSAAWRNSTIRSGETDTHIPCGDPSNRELLQRLNMWEEQRPDAVALSTSTHDSTLPSSRSGLEPHLDSTRANWHRTELRGGNGYTYVLAGTKTVSTIEASAHPPDE